jgi:hypothetical protein
VFHQDEFMIINPEKRLSRIGPLHGLICPVTMVILVHTNAQLKQIRPSLKQSAFNMLISDEARQYI